MSLPLVQASARFGQERIEAAGSPQLAPSAQVGSYVVRLPREQLSRPSGQLLTEASVPQPAASMQDGAYCVSSAAEQLSAGAVQAATISVGTQVGSSATVWQVAALYVEYERSPAEASPPQLAPGSALSLQFSTRSSRVAQLAGVSPSAC